MSHNNRYGIKMSTKINEKKAADRRGARGKIFSLGLEDKQKLLSLIRRLKSSERLRSSPEQ